jgi:hypothetical protein
VGPDVFPNDQCAGTNPPYGALIHYYLKEIPKEQMMVTIMDEKGITIRTLKTEKDEKPNMDFRERRRPLFKIPKQVGINRLVWDLRYNKTKKIKLWTPPTGHEHVAVGPKGWRPFPRGDQANGPLVSPGIYTVKLSVGKKEYFQKIEVRKDPHSTGKLDDIQAQLKISLKIRNYINLVADMINKIEIIRKQIYDLIELLKNGKDLQNIIEEAKNIDKKFVKLENDFFSMELTGQGDGLRWPDKFYVKLRGLAYSIEKSDFSPTHQQLQVFKLFTNRIKGYKTQFDKLMNKELPAFNKLLMNNNILNIVVR